LLVEVLLEPKTESRLDMMHIQLNSTILAP
jgi:hypothetical protein